LLSVIYTGSIQCPSHDVIAYTGQVFYPPASNEHDGVLLEVVAFTAYIGVYFFAIGEAHTCHLPQGRVGLFGSSGIYPQTNATALGAGAQGGRFALFLLVFPSFSD